MDKAAIAPSSVDFIQMRGSSTVMKLMQHIGLQYMDEIPNVRLPLIAGGTAMGYKTALDGTCDIGMASGPMPAHVELWADKNKLTVEEVIIATDGIAAIIHPTNPIAGLSLDQLHDIFTGKISNWNALGNYSGSINVINQDPQLGPYEPWKKQVTGRDHITLKAKVATNNSELLHLVMSDPHAIAYIGTTFLTGANVKVLAINGFLPSYQNIKAEKYPIRNSLRLLTKPNPSPAVKQLIAYCLDKSKGQAIIKGLGLVPVAMES